MSPEDRLGGAGRKQRITPGSEKADKLIGGLLSGFGTRMTARFVNGVGVSPGKKPVHPTTLQRCAKTGFGLVCGKRIQTKTGSRDPESKWAVSRFHIMTQFRSDISS